MTEEREPVSRPVLIDLRRDDTDDLVPVAGTVVCTPTRRRAAATGAATVLPIGFTAQLVDGRALVHLDPSGPGWCWRVIEPAPGGSVRYVHVPAGEGELAYRDLIDVDPATLEPVVEPEAAWWAALRDVADRPVGGPALVPDPDSPGYFIMPSGSDLAPDPDHPGYFTIGE